VNILQIVTRSELGGAQTVVATLASELAARGHKVTIASGPEGGGEAWRGLDSSIERVEIPGLVRAVSPANEIRALAGISRLYRELKPDIVHLHTSKAGLLGRLAPGVSRHHIVYTMHGYFQLSELNQKFLAMDKLVRGLCGAIVAVSKNDKRLMLLDGYSASCVPNGVPDKLAVPPPDPGIVNRIEAIRKSGLPLIMVVARDAVFKRLDLARGAAMRLAGKALVLWLGGDPHAESDPEGFIALGSVDNAAAYLRYADIYFQPSNHEGLSMSLLEALSAGLPCVASSVGGNIETLGCPSGSMRDDGSEETRETACGFLVPNDPEAMAQALATLVSDPERRTRMGLAARAVWESTYSSAAMADGYLAVYKELMNRRPLE
jgi:glycosyltransferase involved in cell wall biosynthesis